MIDLILVTLQNIPGSGKFKKRPLQNKEEMKIMFGDITNDEFDHWKPLSSNPFIPPSQDDVYDIPEDGDGGMRQTMTVLLEMRRLRKLLLLLPLF
jgi:hypothetical protein